MDGTQVSMADVNNDGWFDVYVPRWLVQGPWQTEQPALPGINRMARSRRSRKHGGWRIQRAAPRVFFDVRDKDGDLDLFVINTPLQSGSVFNDDIARSIQQRRSPER